MPTKELTEDLVRRYFETYGTADRKAIELLLSHDFTFTSPYDDRIDRTAYFERCWPSAGTFERHDLKTIFVQGDECFVLYEAKSKQGETFRNTELFRLRGEQIRSVEVFFGRPAVDLRP